MLWRSKPRPGRVLPATFIQPCIASQASKVPAGGGWLHEIKHDGYRMQVRKDGDRVRLFTRRGFDWTERYPLAAAGARKLKAATLTLDCELVVPDAVGVANFDKLHSRCADGEAFLYAFDIMELDGMDLKPLPLIERKAALAKLLRRGQAACTFGTTTPVTAPPCSVRPAKWALRASFRRRRTVDTGQDQRLRRPGSRSKTKQRRAICAFGTGWRDDR
jgi:ATP-dependent DNA ligase